MQEAVPHKIHAPAKEPILRVGIVLAEDKKQTLTFSVQESGGTVSGQGNSAALLPDTQYIIQLAKGKFQISSVVDGVILEAIPPLHLKLPQHHELHPRKGLVLDGVVAGRGFHWQKELTQTLPGNFEFHAEQDRLVVVNELSFEAYIACVVASEMSAVCPPEFSKAQAVAARSWACVFLGNKHPGKPFAICNDDDCQRYQGTTHASAETLRAVHACKGKFLITPEKYVCPAYYSKSCGGHTEDPAEIFGFHIAGFASIADSEPKSPHKVYCSPACVPEQELKQYLGAVDEKGKYYRWSYSLPHDVLVENLRTRFGVTDVQEIRTLSPEKRSKGRRITMLRIGYRDAGGTEKEIFLRDQYDIRRALHAAFLFSSNVELKINREKSGKVSTIDMVGSGWGHGVGLCQIGALGMALSGRGYGEILKHYFPGCELVSAY